MEVDEECDYSPTSVGDGPEGAEGVEIQSPMNPTPLSEPEGSRKGSQESEMEEGGKGGKKGKPHRTWASLTPERMPEEDFKALRHPWAPWPVLTKEKTGEGTTEKPVIPGGEKPMEDETKPAEDEEENEWKRAPGAYSQNYVLLEDAEERRAEMDEEDLRPYTEEAWKELPPWRQERIRERGRKKEKARERSLNSQRPRGAKRAV